jgi:hypothetical protein
LFQIFLIFVFLFNIYLLRFIFDIYLIYLFLIIIFPTYKIQIMIDKFCRRFPSQVSCCLIDCYCVLVYFYSWVLTIDATTPSRTTLSITIYRQYTQNPDNQHNNTQDNDPRWWVSGVMLSVLYTECCILYCNNECRSAVCRYAECRAALTREVLRKGKAQYSSPPCTN